jgi:hypothetical protein
MRQRREWGPEEKSGKTAAPVVVGGKEAAAYSIEVIRRGGRMRRRAQLRPGREVVEEGQLGEDQEEEKFGRKTR